MKTDTASLDFTQEDSLISASRRLGCPFPRDWPRRVRSAVIHTISLAQTSLTQARSVASNSINARIRLKAEVDRLRQEIVLLCEEVRIKDLRMEQIPAQRRPHYPPVERLAILELRAARHWSLAQTAEHFLVTPLTIASWTSRLDEEGPDALVRMPRPVNTFPDFVGYLVRRLKVLCPRMGKTRIANVLCRAGLHLGSTTVRRMLREKPKKAPRSSAFRADRVVTARRPKPPMRSTAGDDLHVVLRDSSPVCAGHDHLLALVLKP